MGLLTAVAGILPDALVQQPTWILVLAMLGIFTTFSVLINVLYQLVHERTRGSEPPLVFHWFPFIGNTVTYGIDPFPFFFECRRKYGDVFTFILLGKKTTVCLGPKGNDFILNGKLKDVNAEEIYGPLTIPVFGSDVVYDCPNAKLMEQKKFVKYGLTTEALKSYVTLIAAETRSFAHSNRFPGQSGKIDLPDAMAELTLYTASRSLQGREVREKFDNTFADLFHDLDMGFAPINFIMPWAPLPMNRKRDAAQKKMADTYMDIVKARRAAEARGETPKEEDMIRHLMTCKYKDGRTIPDKEIAHMMIALLMAGQHSSSATSCWILLRLASRPEITEELLEEQKRVLGADLPEPTYEDLARLPLHAQVVKETLRLHSPIHSMMRKVKQPMVVEGTPYVIPTSHVLLAAPGVTSRSEEFFPEPSLWEPHRWDSSSEEFASLRPKINATTDEEEEKFDYGYGLVSKGASSPYLPFGAGRHRCIGEQFAYLQLQTILIIFVREFKLRNVEGKTGVVGTDYSSLFSRPLHPAVVQWERRNGTEKKEKS